MTSALLIIVFFGLLIINVPIAVCLAISSIVALISGGYDF